MIACTFLWIVTIIIIALFTFNPMPGYNGAIKLFYSILFSSILFYFILFYSILFYSGICFTGLGGYSYPGRFWGFAFRYAADFLPNQFLHMTDCIVQADSDLE